MTHTHTYCKLLLMLSGQSLTPTNTHMECVRRVHVRTYVRHTVGGAWKMAYRWHGEKHFIADNLWTKGFLADLTRYVPYTCECANDLKIAFKAILWTGEPRQTNKQTNQQIDYCNPPTHAPRVNNSLYANPSLQEIEGVGLQKARKGQVNEPTCDWRS